MKKIHKYVVSNFITVFLFSIAFFILLFFLSDFFGRLSSFLKHSVSFKDIVEYYLYYTPFVLYYFMPFLFALSGLITLGIMSVRNELIVMRASGINVFRIASPVFVIAFIVAGLMFVSNEYVVNRSLDRAYFIKTFKFGFNERSGVWVRKGDLFIRVGRLNIDKKTAFDVEIYMVDHGRIEKVIYAQSVELGKHTIARGVHIVDLKNPQLPEGKNLKRLKFDFALNLFDFVKSPQRVSYSFSKLLELVKTDRKAKDFYLSMVVSRILYPFSVVVLFVLSLVFVLKITPRKSDFIRNVFVGGVLFIVYILLFEMLISMGKLSMIQPVVTLVLFVLLWLVFSVYNLLKLGV